MKEKYKWTSEDSEDMAWLAVYLFPMLLSCIF